MLLLKRHLVELVRAGKKRQTIRLWTGKLLKEGAISFTPGLGKMRITKVDELASLEELTEADALADGFGSRKLLLEEIYKIYGRKIPAGRRIFRIGFEWPVGENIKHKTENIKLGAGVDGEGGSNKLVAGKRVEPRRHEGTKGRSGLERAGLKHKAENVELAGGVDGVSEGKSVVRRRVEPRRHEGTTGRAEVERVEKRKGKRGLVGETSEVRRRRVGKREVLRDFILAKAPRRGK